MPLKIVVIESDPPHHQDQESDIRSAAMPILVQRLRRRKGSEKYVYPSIALRAVADVVQHAREQGWAERFYWRVYGSPFYIDALIQLADDADWLPREISLPYHGGPSHPPIYHTIDWRKDCAVPVPMEDSLLRGEYVHTHAGHRIIPVPFNRNIQKGQCSFYRSNIGLESCIINSTQQS